MRSPTQFLRKLSIFHRFFALICVTIIILAFEFGAFWFALTTMSSIRAYVGGNGEWATAQKESMNSLLKYATSFDQSDYDNFLTYLQVPEAAMRARIALISPAPDMNAVTQDFLEADNNINDIPGMIFVFQKFRNFGAFGQLVQLWTASDAGIQQEQAIGAQIHAVILMSGAVNAASTTRALAALLGQATTVDGDLTVSEASLTEALGDASRAITTALLIGVLIIAVSLGLLIILTVLSIARVVQEVDASKNEFVALVSHQLRTPLTVIRLSMNILQKAEFPGFQSEEKRALATISSELPKMASLIDTILDVSRINMGSLAVNPENIDVIAVAKAAVVESALPARERGLHVFESYEPASLVVPMDAILLPVIFQNLISNAVKYTPVNGEVSVAVTVKGSKINIQVSDSGCGIPKDQQRYIFNKIFFRADNVRGNESGTGGTGLGLYIVKSIVAASGGKIWFQSEEGKGTSFFVTFPLTGMKKNV
jgi:signal transduction histidine kinase